MDSQRQVELQSELNRRQQLEQELSSRNQFEQPNKNIFQFQQNPGTRLIDTMPELRDPKQAGLAALQAVGTLGSITQPEIPAIAGGIGLLPKVINAASRAGLQGAFGAMALPENPFVGATLGAASRGIQPIFNKIGNIFSDVKNAFNKVNSKEVAYSVQKTHDALDKSAQDIFENVGKLAKERGVNVVPIDEKLLDETIPHLANTRAVKKFISEAKKGDYESLRKLQTDLFRNATSAEKSGDLANDLKAQEIHDLRDRINESISNYFIKTGNKDLSDDLRSAMSLYRNLKETYYDKELPVAVRKLVHPRSRKMPKNTMNVLSEESEPMKRLKIENPFIEENLQKYQSRKNAIKNLKHLGIISGGIAGTIGAGTLGKSIYKNYIGE